MSIYRSSKLSKAKTTTYMYHVKTKNNVRRKIILLPHVRITKISTSNNQRMYGVRATGIKGLAPMLCFAYV